MLSVTLPGKKIVFCQKEGGIRMAKFDKYDIAAYIWPAYTGKEPRTRIFWPDGIGEWQTVKSGDAKIENGYIWDRKPLWGYVDEADHYVMQSQIAAAKEHGVNVFIYDWYWYDGRPFLEQCLNEGFLKANNCEEMKFYIMWANHDANYLWDKRNSSSLGETIFRGTVNRAEFEKIGHRWINQYFGRSNYYKINGCPVVSIYDLNNFIEGFGGTENAKEAMQWLWDEAIKSGLEGVHFQFIKWGEGEQNITGVDVGNKTNLKGLVEEMGFSSLTHYQFVHFLDVNMDYDKIMNAAQMEWNKVKNEWNIPYFPHVSIGWDNNPRFTTYKSSIMKGNTPERFEDLLHAVKKFTDEYCEIPLITINSWNEWTETSYLEPDNRYGYGYLNAIKRVFVDKE